MPLASHVDTLQQPVAICQRQRASEQCVLESFLARLALSLFVDQLVLKGGWLLAAFGERRLARDVDLQVRTLDNDAENVREELRRLHRLVRRRSFRANALFQLYWNTVGPGGRTWFGNRYVTIWRDTFRIRWRP